MGEAIYNLVNEEAEEIGMSVIALRKAKFALREEHSSSHEIEHQESVIAMRKAFLREAKLALHDAHSSKKRKLHEH